MGLFSSKGEEVQISMEEVTREVIDRLAAYPPSTSVETRKSNSRSFAFCLA
jgi:hypothetical protein